MYNPNKDHPTKISSLLDFFSKILKKTDQNYEGIKKILGIETKTGDDKHKTMFYLVKCEEFENKSLLEYIESQNVRLIRQREELIDLAVEIASLNHGKDTEKAKEEVINSFKSGLASGVALRDMIDMVNERFPWSSVKKWIMVFISLFACISGTFLYVFDVVTDFLFAEEMLDMKKDQEGFESIGYISFAHNILPFLFIFVVFCNKNYRGGSKKTSFIEYLFFCVLPGFWKMPIPILTLPYRFYLEYKSHTARSDPNFKTLIGKKEEEIKKHESSEMIALVLEASLESNFQFWLQSNFRLSDNMVTVLEANNDYEELVNWRTASILLSFITITYSNIKIR